MIEPWIEAFWSLWEPAPIILGFLTIVIAGFLRGFVGFGNSILIVIIFSLLYGPVFAVPFAALASLPPTIQLLPTTIRESERDFVLPFAIAVFVAAPFGVVALISVDPDLLKIGIALIVLVMVYLLYSEWRPSRDLGARGLGLIGVVSGLANGVAGAGGMIVAAAALARPAAAGQQRANTIGGITAVGLCNFPPFLYYGLFTREIVVLSAIMVPVYLVGTMIGIRRFEHGGSRNYRNAALCVLAAVALVALGLSLHAYVLA